VNSATAFAAVFASPSNALDQLALLRARLFDGWLGDWDRHAGQWNWKLPAAGTAGNRIAPLPKDRDMVFYRLDDGILGWLIGHVAIPHWTTFRPRYPNIRHLMSNGEYLDTRGLNQLSRAQFNAMAQTMQQQLPDSLIRRAVRRLPPAAFALEGPGIIDALRARREALPQLADAFYRQLARRPVVGGTAQAERFEVHRYADSTVVAVYAPYSGSDKPEATFRRTYFPAETKTIQLEGLGGNDLFVVEQHGPPLVAKPSIRIYGGPDTDELQGANGGRRLRFSQGSAPPKHAYDKLPED
jgi:hypothetical protein